MCIKLSAGKAHIKSSTLAVNTTMEYWSLIIIGCSYLSKIYIFYKILLKLNIIITLYIHILIILGIYFNN